MNFLKRHFNPTGCLVFAILFALCMIIVVSQVEAEEEKKDPDPVYTYEVLTKDFEAKTLEDVKVNRTMTTVQTMWYTLREVDVYIEMWENKVKEAQETIETLKKMREEIRREAEKVKLKVEGGKTS